MTKVSVVILNWNGWKDTIACVESVRESSKKDLEVTTIVVDNASTNESVSKITPFLSSKHNELLLVNTTNLGFAEGNNVGIRKAIELGAQYVLILNNDTLVSKDCIRILSHYLDVHENVAIAAPKIYFAKGYEFHKDRYREVDRGKVIWYAGGDIDWNNVYGSNHGVDEVDTGQFDSDKETTFATGACFLIRTKVLKEVGLFDQKYFLYLEDADLSLRVQRKGYKIMFVPTAHLWHKVSQSSGIGSQLNDYFITRNRMMFGMRYASMRAKYALARESFRFLFWGRPWQKTGVRDYYIGNLGKGSWKN